MFNFPDPAVFIPLIFALGVMPVAIVMVTSYSKIVVVLSLLKNALGLQQVPPAIVTETGGRCSLTTTTPGHRLRAACRVTPHASPSCRYVAPRCPDLSAHIAASRSAAGPTTA